MNSKTASLLADPHPNCHIVFPCADDEQITEAVSAFALAGLRKDEAVVLVITAPHARSVGRALADDGFDPDALREKGLLTTWDAEALLSKLLVHSTPNPLLFNDVIGSLI